MSELAVESCQLYVPPLEELRQVLQDALQQNFSKAEVEVVDCPNLSEPPFHLAAPGLGGDASLVDLGGVPYLVPTAQLDRLYDLSRLPAMIKLPSNQDVFMIGAGAGPWNHLNSNCEMIANLKLSADKGPIINGTRLVTVDSNCQRQQHTVPINQTGCALLNNLLVTKGFPNTRVLKIRCSGRTGSANFVSCMRAALHQRYPDKVIGMGGTFLLEQGQARLHVMPDFSPCPLNSDDDVNNWLHFYNASAPLINLSVFVSHDPGLDLRVEHTHCFSTHGEGGHYHEDVTPDTVVYSGYYTVAERIFRVDRPATTHQIG